MITTIALDENNRMLRFGFGKHDGNWFVRADLWFRGFRWSNPKSETPEGNVIPQLGMDLKPLMSEDRQSGETHLSLGETGREFK